MPEACQTCVHFRRVKPASQLLAQVLGQNDASVSQALQKIQEDELQLQGHEQNARVSAAERGVETWDARPVMSDYCGAREAQEIFYIAQLKNAGMRCAEHTTSAAPKRTCASCAHRIVSSNQDLEREQLYATQVAGYVAIGKSPSGPEGLWSKHRDAAASRKAFEVAGIYATKGRAHSPPLYFDYCGALSSEGDYVVCALSNTHNTCSRWTERSAAPARSAVDPAPSPALTDPAAVALVRDFIDGLGLMLGIVFSEQQLAVLQRFAAEALAQPRGSDAATVHQYAQEFRSLIPLSGSQRQAFRQSNQALFIRALARDPDRLSQLLVRWHGEATRALAPGTPPLTYEAAKCSIELYQFAHALADAREPPPIKGEASDADVNAFAACYPQKPVSSQQIIAELPGILYELRRGFPTLGTTERRIVRNQLAAMFSIPLSLADLPPVRPTTQLPEPPIERLRREFREARERGDYQLAQVLYLEIQDREQANQLTFQRISDQLNRDHQSGMDILKNFRV